jgi:hypothetical protein
MAQKPITMEQLKQILQLKNDGISIREMARRTGMSQQGTVSCRKAISKIQISLTYITEHAPS